MTNDTSLINKDYQHHTGFLVAAETVAMPVLKSSCSATITRWHDRSDEDAVSIFILRWCGVAWCGVMLCGVVWCGVMLCGVVWCGVVWCGVMLCGVV